MNKVQKHILFAIIFIFLKPFDQELRYLKKPAPPHPFDKKFYHPFSSIPLFFYQNILAGKGRGISTLSYVQHWEEYKKCPSYE